MNQIGSNPILLEDVVFDSLSTGNVKCLMTILRYVDTSLGISDI